MSDDRAQYDGDGDHLDEVVIHNATVHIEQMDTHNWMVMVTRPASDGSPEVYAHLNVQNLTETDDMRGVPYTIGPALLICSEWRDSKGLRHQCTVRHTAPYRAHRCDCGAQKKKGSES